MRKRRFEYENRAENSHKFWEVETSGGSAIIRFGRIGAAGTVQVKQFGTFPGDQGDSASYSAERYAFKMIDEKRRKGYQEVGTLIGHQTDVSAAESVQAVNRGNIAEHLFSRIPSPAAVPVVPPQPAGPRRRNIQIGEP